MPIKMAHYKMYYQVLYDSKEMKTIHNNSLKQIKKNYNVLSKKSKEKKTTIQFAKYLYI